MRCNVGIGLACLGHETQIRPPGLAGISCLVEECNPGLVRVHDHSNVVRARKDKAGAGAGAGAGGTNKNTGLLSFRLRLFLE
jgi:hypothetical protein